MASFYQMFLVKKNNLKMVCFCPLRKIIYIHIPKTGGLTIENILVNEYGFVYFTFNKGRYEFLRQNDSGIGIFQYILENSYESKIYDLESFYKFTFIRNPVDRAMSAIRYLKKVDIFNFPKTFELFLKRCNTDPYYNIHFLISQKQQIMNSEGIVSFDFIGRFEFLMDDLKKVLIDICKLEIKDFKNVHENSTQNIDDIFDFEIISEFIRNKHNEDYEFIK